MKLLLLVVCLAVAGNQLAAADDSISPWQSSLKAEYSRDYDTALADMNSFQQSGGSPFLFRLRTAWLYYLKKDYTDAGTAYAAAEQLQPGAINPLLGLLNVSLVEGDPAHIQSAADAILKIDPLNYRALMAVAYQDSLAKNYGGALGFYQKVLGLYPDDMTALSGRAWCLLDLGRNSEARADFQSLLSVNAGDTASQQGLAQCDGKTSTD